MNRNEARDFLDELNLELPTSFLDRLIKLQNLFELLLNDRDTLDRIRDVLENEN